MHSSEAHEQAFNARSMNVKGVIKAVYDDGQAQLVDVMTQDGFLRTGIEVEQLFGFASRPPVEGGTALLIAIGGDVGHYVALPLGNPSNRFGNLGEGDGGVLYAPDGTRVAALANGTLSIVGMTNVVVETPELDITAPNGVNITGPAKIGGDLTITGDLSTTGSVTIGGSVTVHGTLTAQHVNSLS
jgi:phage baseplate assembly protein V